VTAEPIVRIAARGDGVTPSGRHVPFGVPGDGVLEDGALAYGPHHQEPPCELFPECGGCQLQHVDDEAYAGYLVSRVQTALAQHGLAAEIRPPHLSPPNSRRRATLKALKVGEGVAIGFNAQMSHRVVDMTECHILRPELFALVEPLRKLLAGMFQPGRGAEIQLTLIDRGVDVMIRGIPAGRLTEIEQLTSFAMDHDLARLSVDRGLGPDTLYEPLLASVTLSGVPVAFPHGAFRQATEDGEAELAMLVQEAVAAPGAIADLFAGLGTFALATRAGYAAEASRDAAAALKRSAPAITVEHRDLYRAPLDAKELKRFEAVVLDPPRAGAEEQVATLARSAVQRIAYVSCNPATFGRDARTLASGGYGIAWVRPVGQFRWSTHVELAACFTRGG
jgi:23S rRNA (uracil1939-C5)-methyltransferase